jgi:hypothetical protein
MNPSNLSKFAQIFKPYKRGEWWVTAPPELPASRELPPPFPDDPSVVDREPTAQETNVNLPSGQCQLVHMSNINNLNH